MQFTINPNEKVVTLHAWNANTANNNNKAKITCPKCGSGDCDRIRRSTAVKLLLPWAGLKHYRCARCFKRFYKSSGK